MKHISMIAGFVLLAAPPGLSAADKMGFFFGSDPLPAGWTRVSTDTHYTKERGFGFEEGATLVAGPRGVSSETPFFFSVRVPVEGNYRVSVMVGDARAESTTTIKAELRRLMVEKIHTDAGKFTLVSFIVNTRTPHIAATGDIKAGDVKLKTPRETTQEAWAWDDAITLEFSNTHPAIASIEIEKVENLPTIFLIGDSTVCDQSREPYNSWGQMFTRWFSSDVAVANHGESGETYRDSIGRRRLDKILSVMKPGDFLLMQFGHNDQKQIAAGTGGPFTTYKAELKRHVDGVRARGGIPIVVSPMERRGFDADGKVKPSLIEYANAAREAAKELGVAFIDLNAMSKPFYEALGPQKSAVAFAQPSPGNVDNTHHDNYGSYELAKCVVQSIRDQKLPLAKFIVDDFKGFDPAKPDDPDAFSVPPSPLVTTQRPLGDEANASKK